jgi:hypothetical protein
MTRQLGWIIALSLILGIVAPVAIAQQECPPCVCPCATPLPPDVQPYKLEMGRIEDPTQPSMFAKLEQGQKLIAVEFIISNIAGDPLQVNPMYGTLVDTEGYSYRPQLAARDGGQLEMVTLNPGERARGWLAFAVPESAQPYYIKYDLDALGKRSLQSTASPE